MGEFTHIRNGMRWVKILRIFGQTKRYRQKYYHWIKATIEANSDGKMIRPQILSALDANKNNYNQLYGFVMALEKIEKEQGKTGLEKYLYEDRELKTIDDLNKKLQEKEETIAELENKIQDLETGSMKNMFFIDAETDGLYGSFLTVGIIVTDSRCNEMERYYFGLPKEKMSVTDPWVIEHVIPILGEYEECQSEHEMLEKVWAVWMKHKDTAYAIADVPFPVESRLFWQCVQVDEKSRKYDGPFPLLDLSSMLAAKGFDSITDRERLYENNKDGKQHNALYDVEMEVGIYRRLILGGT